MLAEVMSGAVVGVECVLVRVEVSVTSGLPAISVVGLPYGAVREGRDRVRAALQAAGYSLPPRRITVNLSPADVRKEGSGFDFPLAFGLLVGSGHIPADAVAGHAFIGELSLGGELRPVPGVLAMAAACREAGLRGLVVPCANQSEAAAGAGALPVFGADRLEDALAHFRGERLLEPVRVSVDELLRSARDEAGDLAEVRGHGGAKRALEVAAAGGHNLLLTGPPGSGKTMLARRLPGILPALTREESLEVTAIHSVAGLLNDGRALIGARPFRAPHHTISRAGLVGGGSPVRPGEISLAHHGILFLDELPEFPRNVLEALRQPLEDGWVSIVRARDRVRLPARFTLVAAMNPCPCGHLGDPRNDCTCDPTQVARYRARISGPLRDRIDMHVEVPVVPYRELANQATGESSAVARERVKRAREMQRERWGADSDGRSGGRDGDGGARGGPAYWNAALSPSGAQRWCRPDCNGERLLEDAADRMGLSARGVHRVLKVARTIADLEESEEIAEGHLAEAVQYRG